MNLRRNPAVSVLVHSDEWNGPYVQVHGTAEVLDVLPGQEAETGWWSTSPASPTTWTGRIAEAVRERGKSLIRVTVTEWGPIATGGFPPDRVPS